MITAFARKPGLGLLYAVVIFLSAFLLFQVQPLIGKCILPWFGGTPAVWTTCMLVFQLLLFAGYAYAHLTTQYLRPVGQAVLHAALLVAAISSLPILPEASWKPSGEQAPTLRIVCLLLSTIGLPYFVLSATSPLVQAWFSRTHQGQAPYRLYALSNVGSLLALVSYPFVVEPSLATTSQAWVWSLLFGGYAGLCGLAAWWMLTAVSQAAVSQAAVSQAAQAVATEADLNQPSPTWGTAGLWFGLSMSASILLLATTNQVCMDVAVVPFLWVLPLALYLITFILCFESERWYVRRYYAPLTAALLMASFVLIGRGSYVSISLQIGVFFAMMFGCCMICHGELAALKPASRFLTGYFLTISAGGAAGGLFVGIVAPVLFVNYNELYFGVFMLMSLFVCLRLREDQLRWPLAEWTKPALAAALVLLVLGILSQVGRHDADLLAVRRNFYGVLRVHPKATPETNEPLLQLAHGRIAHGSQFVSTTKRHIPTAYYATSTGIGQVMQGLRTDASRHIGIVGLGVGTLAAYAQPGDRLRMYEINPQVIELAEEHFTFLRDCPAEKTIVTGDARLSLEFEPPQEFDLLVLDAFSGDAIPVHLLTSEALQVYLRHVGPDGILAYHISNLHFDLKPVIAGLAAQENLSVAFYCNQQADTQTAALVSIWAVLARSQERLEQFFEPQESTPPSGLPIHWTDNRSNLLQVMW